MPNRVPLLLFFSFYVKMQQAYAAEQNAIGGWTLIGYTAPGNGSTTNFNYSGAVTADGTAATSTKDAWKAASKVDLNDCKAASAWSLTAVPGVGGAVTINTVLTQASGSGAGACLALTPSFHQIGDGKANSN
ncbi:hypothetical protein [Fibrobacter sp. UWS1]|uniref:hypothetical protein n=1 Tax=Fibrobacter sp. UWS1 TaxID=1896220 RepID=UPI000BB165BA|nr:hypothetical protein [Fibrobacter sp. UWS1]PBC69013.1 hypothetical protein BGX14_1403 [Fibrobacter sp. UWS1]